ncbi:carboxylesterase/lipase family protein [Streptomyces sp. NPDC058371]|uniref:carboxylesterase/lipase family protein n=1 Tax=Streptomyces sp. NPDC058371 TaxID=3346463 RepID=UPI00364E9128
MGRSVDPSEGPVVTTPYGAVRGRYEKGVAVFRGIPFAAPPFGPHRFRPPVPPERWDGVRDAGTFGPTPPKPPYSEAFARLLSDPVVAGDDCLNLNVWTPDPAPGARLPVMVWVHGGALTRGSSAVPVYDGSSFARDGIVLVSFNYRLGLEGYGLFPDAPPNLGLHDQLAALEWVHDAIAGFGGDPDRVTVFGESAGAISIGALLASPRAAGLFRRAVLQSGPPEATEREKVRRLVRRMATRLKIPATAAAFAAVDRPLLAEVQAEVGRRASPILGGPAFGIVVDGDLVPRDPLAALLDGAARDIDLMMGWTSEEYRLWLAPTGLVERIDRLGPVAVAGAMARCHCGPDVPRGYRAAHPDAGTADLVGQLVTDHLLRVPLHRLADARLHPLSPAHDASGPPPEDLAYGVDGRGRPGSGVYRVDGRGRPGSRAYGVDGRGSAVGSDGTGTTGNGFHGNGSHGNGSHGTGADGAGTLGLAAPSYVYEFAWPSNVPGLGACHALELGFVFDTADVPESTTLAGGGAPQELADAMHGAWVRFAVDGDPGWPAWDASHPVRIFGAEPELLHGPRDHEMALWQAEYRRQEAAPASAPANGSPTRTAAPLSAVRRLRRPGGVRRT